MDGFGIRLNQEPPRIAFKKKDKGGINFQCMTKQSTLDLQAVTAILKEYRIHNADITMRCDATLDQFIDVVEGNRKYMPAIYVLNMIDKITIEELDIIARLPHCCPISAAQDWNLDDLIEMIWNECKMLRIYTKPKGQIPDYSSPVILHDHAPSVANFCNRIHKGLLPQFHFAWVWGSSVKHQPQRVGKEHILRDEDIVQIVKKI